MDEFKTPATKRRVAEAMLLGGEWARPLMASPGTPADRVAVLRAAYEKVAKDPELIAEAKKMRIDVTPVSRRKTSGHGQRSDGPAARSDRADQKTLHAVSGSFFVRPA